MRDVVAIAEVSERRSWEVAAVLADRQQIRQNLTGVLVVREGVDDGRVGRIGQRLELLLLEGA